MINLDAKDWADSYKWQFEAYPFFTSVFTGLAAPTKNKYYAEWDKSAHCIKNGQNEEYASRENIDRAGQIIIEEALAGKREFLNLFSKAHQELEEVIALCLEKKTKENLRDELLWWPAVKHSLSDNVNLMFNCDFPFDSFLTRLKVEKPEDYRAVKAHLHGEKESFINVANDRLRELIKKYSSDFSQVYKIFYEEYGWFQNSYKGIFEFDKNWLKNYAQNLGDPSEIKEISNIYLPEKYQILAKIGSKAITFKDDKKKLLLVAVVLMQNWLEEMCREKSWDYEVMRWLTMDEIRIILQGDENLLKKAQDYSQADCRIGLMTETGFADISEEFWQEVLAIQNKNQDNKLINGSPASKGRISGQIKIILDPRVDNDFVDGDILVTSMTRPEFISIMKKASAIITDEGGIACHASIISRELKIPCIVGTKIATKVLKDGDMVEVDADKGVVRRLNG